MSHSPSKPGFELGKNHSTNERKSLLRKPRPTNQFRSKGPPFELQLPQAVKVGVRAHEYVGTRDASPWENFEKVFELKFDDFKIVAIRKASPCELVTVRLLGGPSYEDKLQMLQQIRHENFVALGELYRFQGCSYAIVEHVLVSLVQIVLSPPYPTERQLAAILGQVLNGLAYLKSKGLVHGSLDCSNVLLSDEGIVKITSQENCFRASQLNNCSVDVRAVGRITMELMQKYPKDDGNIGVEDLNRWPSDSDAVGFLSETTSVNCVTQLMKHPLILSKWCADELRWMVDMAAISVGRSYRY